LNQIGAFGEIFYPFWSLKTVNNIPYYLGFGIGLDILLDLCFDSLMLIIPLAWSKKSLKAFAPLFCTSYSNTPAVRLFITLIIRLKALLCYHLS
jgi:hypothetical protein